MELKIAGYTITKYRSCNIHLKYDAPASTFSFDVYYDPNDSTHRNIYRPLAYHRCEVKHGGVLVLTGTLLNSRLSESNVPEWQTVTGYSLPGVLDDTCILNTDETVGVNEGDNTAAIPQAPLDFSDNPTLEFITRQVIKKQGIELIIDPEVQKDPNFSKPFAKVTVSPEQSISSLIDGLCRRKYVVLSHTAKGELFLTRAKSDAILTTSTTLVRLSPTAFSNDIQGAPESNAAQTNTVTTSRAILWDFSKGGDIRMSLSVNGQKMHRVVQVLKQYSKGTATVAEQAGAAVNPYVPADSRGLRFRREVQTIGDENDILPTARMIIGSELKEIVLTIEVQGWTLGGNLITPNQMITVQNPAIGLHKKSKWFIQEVQLSADNVTERAVLTCVLPECFNQDKIINVFL
jgi:prophage tail gpP-like protein